MFFFRDTIPGADGPIEIGFTDSALDVSTDRPGFTSAVQRLEAACGVPLARMTQVHGAEVRQVDGPPSAAEQQATADALVTGERGVGLMVRVADCVPVLLLDPQAGVVGAVHSGRPGTVAGVVEHAVQRMRDLGAIAPMAYLGPSVCGGCYEVPEQMRDEVSRVVPGSWAQTSWGTPSVDLVAGIRTQLTRAGVAQVRVIEGCTLEEPTLHSYRRDGEGAGRSAGVVWMP